MAINHTTSVKLTFQLPQKAQLQCLKISFKIQNLKSKPFDVMTRVVHGQRL